MLHPVTAEQGMRLTRAMPGVQAKKSLLWCPGDRRAIEFGPGLQLLRERRAAKAGQSRGMVMPEET